jgi:hypothetical protein
MNTGNLNTGSMKPIRAGVDSSILDSRLAADSTRGRDVDDDSDNTFDAAIGIRNGLTGGMAFWTLAYLLLILFRTFA